MSDPVTQVEIEDVLSSIRRLVSENARVPLVAAVPNHAVPIDEGAADDEGATDGGIDDVAEAADGAADRLVLTPALRVSDMDDGAIQDETGQVEAMPDEAWQDEAMPDEAWQDEAMPDDAGQDEAGQSSSDVEEASEFWGFSTQRSSEPDTLEAPAGDDLGDSMVAPETTVTGVRAGQPEDDFSESNEDGVQDNVTEDVPETTASFGEENEENEENDDGDGGDDGIALSDARALDSRIVQWGRLGVVDDHPYEPDVPGDSDYAGTDVEALNWGASDDFREPLGPSVIEKVTEIAEDTETEATETEATETEETAITAGFDGSGGSDCDEAGDDATATDPDDLVGVAERFEVEQVVQDQADLTQADESTIEATAVGTDARQDTGADPEKIWPYDDTSVDGDVSGGAQGFSTRIEAEAQEFVAASFESAIAPELEGFDPDDTAFLDEAMLRDLVGDIVRQELQGALGERITRNVRKLVRREIHRALAAHDLE